MPKETHNPKATLLNLMIFLCAAAMLTCGVLFVIPLFEYRAGDALYLELSQHVAAVTPAAQAEQPAAAPVPTPFPMLQLDFAALTAQNDEFYAWLYAEGTVINYPIVQGGNNSYYLAHLFNKERNPMGTLFVDAGNAEGFADQNTLVYGHHMKNGAMFASLVNYKDQTYYNVHPTMLLFLPDATYRVELFAGYITDGYATNDVYKKSFDTEADFLAFLEHAREQSDFISDAAVTASDRIVTLSTCTYEYDEARYVVHGKLVPITP